MHSSFIGLTGSNRNPINVCVCFQKWWQILVVHNNLPQTWGGFRMNVLTAGLCGPLHHLAPQKAFLLLLLPLRTRGLVVCWSEVMDGVISLECEVWSGWLMEALILAPPTYTYTHTHTSVCCGTICMLISPALSNWIHSARLCRPLIVLQLFTGLLKNNNTQEMSGSSLNDSSGVCVF